MQTRRPGIRLEDLLLRHGAISPEQLARAKEEQQKWGGELGRIFVELGFISEELLMRALAHSLGTHYCDPATEALDPQIVRAIGVQLCERFGVIPVAGELGKKVLRVASADPGKAELLAELGSLTGYRVEAYAATSQSIALAIRRHFYGDQGGAGEAVTAPGGFPAAAAPAPAPAPAAPAPARAPPPAAPAARQAELEALTLRVARLEAYLAAVKRDLSTEIASNPQIAGLAARLEHLEQAAQNDVGSLRAVVELLLDRGIFTLDQLAAKVKQVRTR